MTDAGFFRGTSTEQDNRFSDKEKKLLKQIKFAENVTKKVDMTKVKLDTIKPWITSKITELLGGMEDDVVVEYVFNQLEADKVITWSILLSNSSTYWMDINHYFPTIDTVVKTLISKVICLNY